MLALAVLAAASSIDIMNLHTEPYVTMVTKDMSLKSVRNKTESVLMCVCVESGLSLSVKELDC